MAPSRNRNLIVMAILFVAILIMYNILSSNTLSEDPDHYVGDIVLDQTHEFERMKKQIEELQARDDAHQQQIAALTQKLQQHITQQPANGQATKIEKSSPIPPPPKLPPQQQQPQYIDKSLSESLDDDDEPLTLESGSSFKLIPEDEIIYPLITINNNGISDTPNTANSVIIKDINDNNVIYEKDNGIIHGNPLLIDKCMNILTTDHEINILSSISFYHNSFVPWFWSRETIGSVLQNKKFKLYSNILASDTFDNLTNAIYVKIDNSASKIMENTLLKSINILQKINAKPNTRIQSKCGFTFVQHPITRFIAGIIIYF